MTDIYEPQLGGVMGEVFVAEATAVTDQGIALTLPGQTQRTRKLYRSLTSASVSPGDQVLCVRISGTYIVLGPIGLAQDAGDGFLFIPVGSSGLITRDGKVFVSKREE